MLQLTQKELEELHKVQLEMLLELKRICKKNGINYFLLGGTLLGAVRHEGYIPWDDDADVGMLREDYEKFRVACEKELDENKFYFQDDRNTEGYRWGYGKIRRKHTLFLREHQEHLPFGQEIFIDVFPLDYAPDNMLCRRVHMFFCFIIRKILWAPVGKEVENNGIKKCLYLIASKIPKQNIYKKYYKFIFSRKKTKTVRINLFPTRKPYGFPIDMFTNLEEFVFEKNKFMGIRKYNEYLKIKYGDYMKLPSVEQRKIHPVSAIEFVENAIDQREK